MNRRMQNRKYSTLLLYVLNQFIKAGKNGFPVIEAISVVGHILYFEGLTSL